ncbi:ATP-binding cassette domain-containing protein [Helicobacter burdigaliensis]|uniref:ATP-binding cassette domain-containing protein n=1 Tax=Helicobacter burdigaliensis TaxID=2315334 RepID=UPI000EF6623E|nr:ATP-binding cassette domain-containing protein [Helicobacter burdigaliensis]
MIEIENLNLSFCDKTLLENISFTLQKGENLAIMGKSGSGKSLLLKSLIYLFDKNYSIKAQRFQIYSKNPLLLNAKELSILRAKVSLIFQDVYGSFYPLIDIGSYFNIVGKKHTNLSKKEIKKRSFYYFECLGLQNFELLWHSFIYQLSGGMARRVQIALALVCEANCLLCDEITSSLDSKNEQKIIQILKDLKENFANLIFVTHNLNLAYELSHKILILEEGKIEEFSDIEEFKKQPKSTYGRQLLKIHKELEC